MSDVSPGVITQMLRAAESGDTEAARALLPMVYRELRRLAATMMAKTPPGNTLQPTELVHEAYVRLVERNDPGWNSRGHFFSAAAEAMRRILVEQARRKGRLKHGGKLSRVNADEVDLPIDPPSVDVLALDEALNRLARIDERKAEVVKLRYFTGLTIEEVAMMKGISKPTVERDWRFARAFLFDQMDPST